MSSFAIHGTTRRRTNPIFPVVKFSQTSYKVKPATFARQLRKFEKAAIL
jgi:hypothetical protein